MIAIDRGKSIKSKIVIIILIFIFIALIFYLNSTKDCGSDISCFDKVAAECSKASVTAYKDNNQYFYKILGSKKENCIVDIKLLKLSEDQPYDIKQALEGKSMTCTVPKLDLRLQSLNEMKNINDKCTGQLKEAILQITIDKMYEIIVKSIGPIALEAQKNLE